MAVVPSGALPTELDSSGIQTLRAAATLTDTYVPGNSFFVGNYNHVTLLASLTKAAITSAELLVQFSQDSPAVGVEPTNWFKGTNKSVAGGTTTVTLSDPIQIPVATMGATETFIVSFECAPAWIRVSAKGTAADFTASSMTIQAVANHK